MSHTEQELKFELSEATYQRLLLICEMAGPVQRFSNLYFQAAEPVERQDWVLRLRREGEGEGELTLKVGKEVSPGMFRSIEYTATVQGDDPAGWKGTEPLRVFAEEVSALAPVFRGASHNERRVLRAPLGPVVRWELDRTRLPDGTEFCELEIEWEPENQPTAEEVAEFRADLERWFSEQGLAPGVPSRKTKYRRFLDSLAD